jgi:hypothetical protein
MKDVMSRMYIPASYRDNPLGLERDPGYPGRVKAQGRKHEMALLNSDWDAFAGDFFSAFDPSPHVVDGKVGKGMCLEPFAISKGWRIVASVDPGWAAGRMSCGLKAIDLKGNHYRVGTWRSEGAGMEGNVEEIYQWVKMNKYLSGRMPEMWVCGLDAWVKHTQLAIKGEEITYADFFLKKGIVLQRAVTDRLNGWGMMNNLMETGRWFFFDGLNDALVDEIQAAEHDELRPDDIKGRGNDPEVSDHSLDDERYNVMATTVPRERKQTATASARDYGVNERSAGKKKGPWEPGMG